MEDTICAVSTAPGAGGIAVIASPDRKQSQSATRYSYRVQQERPAVTESLYTALR